MNKLQEEWSTSQKEKRLYQFLSEVRKQYRTSILNQLPKVLIHFLTGHEPYPEYLY